MMYHAHISAGGATWEHSVDNVKKSSDSAAYSVENKEFGDLCYNV